MSQAQRVKKLEGRARSDGRVFVLRQSWSDKSTFRVWPSDELLTRDEFKARFRPSAEDVVIEIEYVDDWRDTPAKGVA